jgi:hypothetical protein
MQILWGCGVEGWGRINLIPGLRPVEAYWKYMQ